MHVKPPDDPYDGDRSLGRLDRHSTVKRYQGLGLARKQFPCEHRGAVATGTPLAAVHLNTAVSRAKSVNQRVGWFVTGAEGHRVTGGPRCAVQGARTA